MPTVCGRLDVPDLLVWDCLYANHILSKDSRELIRWKLADSLSAKTELISANPLVFPPTDLTLDSTPAFNHFPVTEVATTTMKPPPAYSQLAPRTVAAPAVVDATCHVRASDKFRVYLDVYRPAKGSPKAVKHHYGRLLLSMETPFAYFQDQINRMLRDSFEPPAEQFEHCIRLDVAKFPDWTGNATVVCEATFRVFLASLLQMSLNCHQPLLIISTSYVAKTKRKPDENTAKVVAPGHRLLDILRSRMP